MLSNKVVFLAQRYSKFKDRCLRWNNFLWQERGAGGDLDPSLFFSTPGHLYTSWSQPNPSSIFFFQAADKSHYGADSECHRAGPCFHGFLLMSPDCGWVSVFVRVL